MLVVDKERLECMESKQTDLVHTIRDLKAANLHAHVAVPLIVIVNKVRMAAQRL